jgi:hypothetical protein
MLNTTRFIALTSLAAVMAFAPMAKADEWNKKTILTVKETIQLPNTVLPPGTYTFKLLDSLSDRHIVQVFDKDGMHLVTTVLAIPNYRLQPKDESEFAFWEVPAGQPPALRAWFYPGDNFGQEFAYPKNMSTQIAASAKMTVPTTTAVTPEEMTTAPIITAEPAYTPAPEPAPVVAPVETPREVAAAAPLPVPVPVEIPAELPHTASSVPLIGLLGLVSMVAYFTLRPSRVR